MNALERCNLIAEMEEYVGSGCSQSLEDIIGCFYGGDIENLDRHTLASIDERFFCCDQCNWTMPVDELAETEAGDGFLCKECADE